MAELVALAIGIFGVASVIFAAMRWRRDDTTQVVTQQSAILNDMHVLNDEIRISADKLRTERDKCYEEVAKLRQATDRIERKLDDG